MAWHSLFIWYHSDAGKGIGNGFGLTPLMVVADDWFINLPGPCIRFGGGSDGMPFELDNIPKGGGGGGIPGIPGGGGGGIFALPKMN